MITTMLAHRGSYAPTIINGRTRFRQRWVFTRPRGFYRMVLVEDGVHTLELADGPLHCRSNSVYLILPGVSMRGQVSPGAKAMMISFTIMACDLRSGGEPGESQVLHIEAGHQQPTPQEIWGIDLPHCLPDALCTRINPLVRGISASWWLGDQDHFIANRRLAEILDVVYEHYVLEQKGGVERNNWSGWLASVLPEIESQLPKLHTVADLTALTGISATHLNREFRRAVGETPGAFLRRRRLERAADMFQHTDMTMKHIAEYLGYSSQSAFNNAWKRCYGMSPNQWRRGIQQRE